MWKKNNYRCKWCGKDFSAHMNPGCCSLKCHQEMNEAAKEVDLPIVVAKAPLSSLKDPIYFSSENKCPRCKFTLSSLKEPIYLPSDNKWVSCKDRLPSNELGQYIACTSSGAVMEMAYSSSNKLWFFAIDGTELTGGLKVVYWMNMPQSPFPRLKK